MPEEPAGPSPAELVSGLVPSLPMAMAELDELYHQATTVPWAVTAADVSRATWLASWVVHLRRQEPHP